MLEALTSASASFVTLTYKEVPDGGSLVPRDLTLWFKRLRKHRGFRYFAVGEYGDFSERPHYHAALFGFGVEDTDVVRETWGMGHVLVGDLTLASAAYVAGYVTKKMTGKDDVRLNGRYPEFARMSLRPGIGAGAIPEIASAVLSEVGGREVDRTGDVPDMLRHGRGSYPLGRYLRRLLREQTDIQARDTGVKVFEKSRELQALYASYEGSAPFALHLEEKAAQRRLNQAAKFKIRNGGKTL